MPHRHAHWYLLALFPLAGLAFWRSYLAQFGSAPAAFHLHGMTASLWLLLLIFQSWSIQRGERRLHRTLGLASLGLFPLFLAGGSGIFLGMAQRFAEQASPFYTLYAPRLAWLDVVAVAGFAWFYFEAMRRRRQVQLHARYLLATVLFLLPPILGRLMPALPPLTPSGPEDLSTLGAGFQLANAVTALIAFALAARSGRHARPWWLAGGLIVLSALLYEFPGGTEAWRANFARLAEVPLAPAALAAAAGGVMVSAAGWIAGRRPPEREPLAA